MVRSVMKEWAGTTGKKLVLHEKVGDEDSTKGLLRLSAVNSVTLP